MDGISIGQLRRKKGVIDMSRWDFEGDIRWLIHHADSALTHIHVVVTPTPHIEKRVVTIEEEKVIQEIIRLAKSIRKTE